MDAEKAFDKIKYPLMIKNSQRNSGRGKLIQLVK